MDSNTERHRLVDSIFQEIFRIKVVDVVRDTPPTNKSVVLHRKAYADGTASVRSPGDETNLSLWMDRTTFILFLSLSPFPIPL